MECFQLAKNICHAMAIHGKGIMACGMIEIDTLLLRGIYLTIQTFGGKRRMKIVWKTNTHKGRNTACILDKHTRFYEMR